jgi:hypothetical protein
LYYLIAFPATTRVRRALENGDAFLASTREGAREGNQSQLVLRNIPDVEIGEIEVPETVRLVLGRRTDLRKPVPRRIREAALLAVMRSNWVSKPGRRHYGCLLVIRSGSFS